MNAETGDRWTALAFAAQGGHTESVQILLASGAGDRDFALQRAAQHGHTETVQVLLSQGADVDAKTAAGGLP